jgi:hypothetical protein
MKKKMMKNEDNRKIQRIHHQERIYITSFISSCRLQTK